MHMNDTRPLPPIFYCSRYLFLGRWNPVRLLIDRLHPFDLLRYLRIRNALLASGLRTTDFTEPRPVATTELLSVHSHAYLDSLSQPDMIAHIIQLDFLSYIPMSILEACVLDPFRFGTGGTLEGLRAAVDYGCAINLGGGYHHAKADSGSGFCFFADIPAAVRSLMGERDDMTSVLIIDLDAHQGNGYATIFGDDPHIHIFDIYNRHVFPIDFESRKFVEYDFPLDAHSSDDIYLQCLERHLPDCIAATKPDVAIYIAGTDVLKGDPLGYLDLSPEAVCKRDSIVYNLLLSAGVPMLMVLGGGNLPEGAHITGRSIQSIISEWRKEPHPAAGRSRPSQQRA